LQDFEYTVSLQIRHPDIAPEMITRALALQPTHRPTRKGEPKTTPKGAPLAGYWEFSHWSHRFEITQDRELVPYLERLVKSLEPQRDFLQRLVDEGGAVECFVGVFTDTNCDQVLPFGLLGELAELRIDLRLDLYGSKLRHIEHPPSDQWEDYEAAATALVSLAQQRGVDLARYCGHSQFLNKANGRYIVLWLKEGTAGIGYSMQGQIAELPREFAESASAFSGMWHEAGTLPDTERAFEFVLAWLLYGTEVDQLPVPERERRRYGIG